MGTEKEVKVTKAISVSIKPILRFGMSGFRVSCYALQESWFVKDYCDAKKLKVRLKEGKKPKQGMWAIKL